MEVIDQLMIPRCSGTHCRGHMLQFAPTQGPYYVSNKVYGNCDKLSYMRICRVYYDRSDKQKHDYFHELKTTQKGNGLNC